jgi:hypothetical protein
VDEYFQRAGKAFHEVQWVIPYREMTVGPTEQGKHLSVLTEEQRRWNSHVSDI